MSLRGAVSAFWRQAPNCVRQFTPMLPHPLTEVRKTRPDAMLWANMAVRPGFSWPNVLVEIPFEGKTMVLQPGGEDHSQAVSLYDEQGTSFDEGGSRISRFLSQLAWSHEAALIDLFISGSNNPASPGRLGRSTKFTAVWTGTDPWRSLYLPAVPDARAHLGLGLYRQGLGLALDSPPFSLLSFMKVLNIVHAGGPEQINWIDTNVDAIPNWSRGKRRLDELRAAGQSAIGAYLYGQGRCAVAHANATTVNPDDYGDTRRLSADLPLVQELASLFVERELGVEREHTFSQRIRDLNTLPESLLVPCALPNGRVGYVQPGQMPK